MKIEDKIKEKLKEREKEGKIWNVNYEEDLKEIEFTNSLGLWEFKKCLKDICNCGEVSDYSVLLNGFMQTFECKECLLGMLISNEENVWTNENIYLK